MRIVRDEETRYATTFQVAERFFHDEAKSAVNGVLPGTAAFKLYDTYGLALDEQEEMAREFGLTIDRQSFLTEMEKQRARARSSWRGADKAQIADVYKELPVIEFIGRESLEAPVEVLKLIVEKIPVDLVEQGTAEVVFPSTPFYAESGGQVGDTGLLLDPETREKVAVVNGVYKPTSSAMVHKSSCAEADQDRRQVGRRSRLSITRGNNAESYRDPSPSCGIARGSGRAREAGGQRGRAGQTAL